MKGDPFRTTVAAVMRAFDHDDDDSTLAALRQAHAGARRRGIDDAAYARAIDVAAVLAEQGLTPLSVRAGAGDLEARHERH